jgi:GT2 family glycosyltransferase
MREVPGLISLVIVNYNGRDYLPECVASARGQAYPRTELVLVDNGSTDGSREWLRESLPSGAILVELDRNTGFAGGANAGIRAGQGEFCALLNNDAVADPDWLVELALPMADPGVGMVASKILFYDEPGVIDKTGHLLFPDGLNRGRGAGEVDRGQFDADDDALFPDGCAALYRRRMLEEVGLFDEQFFAYGDDADLGLRARWQGWRCRYAARARVYHRHSRTLGKYSPEKAFLVERNRLWVAVKLFPWPLLALTPLFTLWRFAWHAGSILSRRGLAGGVAREHSPVRLAAALLRAYASGIAGLPRILAKRRAALGARRLTDREFYRLLARFRVSARELALRD